jgi:CheY-like chemotaxis protein
MPPSALFAPDASKQTRVLYAEDQTSSRVVTTALLQKLGYAVTAVEDGERAVECARQETFDVILLDIEMPVMDGVTAARMIRSEATQGRAAPIVALSAFLADSTEATHWRDAFDSFLPKPANCDQLQSAVNQALLNRTIVPDNLIEDLKAVLPRGAWKRLAENAATEMHNLALTWAACLESDDQANAAKAGKALTTLAKNFGATAIVSKGTSAKPKVKASRLDDLLVEIRLWKNENTA